MLWRWRWRSVLIYISLRISNFLILCVQITALWLKFNNLWWLKRISVIFRSIRKHWLLELTFVIFFLQNIAFLKFKNIFTFFDIFFRILFFYVNFWDLSWLYDSLLGFLIKNLIVELFFSVISNFYLFLCHRTLFFCSEICWINL